MMNAFQPSPTGRGSHANPPNRFGVPYRELDLDQIEHDADTLEALAAAPTTYLADTSRSIISENESPDIPFRYSLNPYRGCSHGCSYCYARTSHEYLGLNAGLDFETRIFVKHSAPDLFRDFLNQPKWRSEIIAISGITDPYQPAEREFRITRGCLEVAWEARQPIGLITKNALIVRDRDLLGEMAANGLIHANISITTLNAELARVMEPRTSTPAARLRAITVLRDAGVPVRVMVAPVIPGLNDAEIPAILRAAKEAGAISADYIMLRLPLTVAPVFAEWLERTQPAQREKVEARLRSVRDGRLNDSGFGTRMRGEGEIADQIHHLFKLFTRKLELDRGLPPLDFTRFAPPRPRSGQMRLF